MSLLSIRIAIVKWLQYAIIIMFVGGFAYFDIKHMYESLLSTQLPTVDQFTQYLNHQAFIMLGFALGLTLLLELFGAWRHSQAMKKKAPAPSMASRA